MKTAIAAIFLIALMGQTFDRGLIILDYYVNKSTYEQNCVNKDKPMMHCCGKCQLRKRLQQEEKDNQSTERRMDNKETVVLSSESFFATVPPLIGIATKIDYPYLSPDKEIKMPRSIFHPPGA